MERQEIICKEGWKDETLLINKDTFFVHCQEKNYNSKTKEGNNVKKWEKEK